MNLLCFMRRSSCREEKMRKQQLQLLECNIPTEAAPAADTPIFTKPLLSDVSTNEPESRILRSSNAMNRLIYGSTLSKASEVSQEGNMRKRGFRSGETENNIPVSLREEDKEIRSSKTVLKSNKNCEASSSTSSEGGRS